MSMKTSPRIILASQSPRRAELLTQIGVDFEVRVSNIDESRQSAETPEDFVTRLAMEKALAGMQAGDGDVPVLGSDTIVLRDNVILGKPANRDEAAGMLTSLSGRSHEVLTAVALVNRKQQSSRLCSSIVTFRSLSAAEIIAYCDSGEPDDKAGSYAIQGRAAAFISHIDGSFSGVMGLPLFETAELLAEFEMPVL